MSERGIIGPTMSDIQGYLPPRDIMKIINASKSLRDRTILTLLWTTGCRLGELLLLKIEDISFEKKILFMWTLKRKKKFQRHVLVNEASLDLIREYMKVYGVENGVLISLSARRIREIVYECGVRAGVPMCGRKMLHPHHFRHSHCVAWVRRHPTMEGLKALQERLGHASFATTAFYLKFSFEDQMSEVESTLNEMLAPPPQGS